MSHAYSGIAANTQVKTIGGAKVFDYASADAFLDGANMAQLASNIRLFRHEHHIGLVLYDTEIIRYYDTNDCFSVDNGGHNTPTTSARVNQFTPPDWHFWHDNKMLVTITDGDDYDRTRYGNRLRECTHDDVLPNRKPVPAGVGFPD